MPGPLCTSCGGPVSAGEAMRNPRLCPACRANYDAPAAEGARAIEERDRKAYQIDGECWWFSTRPQVLVRYPSFAELEAELEVAAAHGWRIAQTDTSDDHSDVTRAVIFGALALLAASRSGGPVTVTWERQAATLGDLAGDPVATLKQLKELLDLALISEDEYAAKKGEILARL